MNGDKKLYLYSGLAILGAIVAYYFITNKKKLDSDPTNNTNTNEEDVTTTTGDIITPEQAEIDPTIAEIIKLPLVQTKAKLLGKKIYTKIDNVNPRLSNYVNNGWFVNNTLGGRITQQGTLIGIVTDVVNDKGSLKNNGGAIYKWIKVKPSAEAIKQIKDDCSFLNCRFTYPSEMFVREDVIKL